MFTKLVLRLLDASGTLLGWTEVRALAKGDGCLWATHPVLIAIEEAGLPTILSVHWADVHVEYRMAIAHAFVSPGQLIPIESDAAPLVRVGSMPEYLPPVTVRAPVGVAVPVGGVGVLVP